jgi:predicted RNA binding protein YcfA (HicA-like mRNA interferase family)
LVRQLANSFRGAYAPNGKQSKALSGKPDKDKPYWEKWRPGISGIKIGSDLEKNGWIKEKHDDGSHAKYRKNNLSVTVPQHNKFSNETYYAILKKVKKIESLTPKK